MSKQTTDSTRPPERILEDPAEEAVSGSPADPATSPGNESAAESISIPTFEELASLRQKAAQADDFKDWYLRSVAELENFRKRAARERQEAIQFANQGLLEKLVPALDNLDMALAAVSSAQGSSLESLKTGVEMVLGQLRSVLREAGLEEIDGLGQPFDPAWHDAVSQQETSEVPEGHVFQQLRKGYRLNQRLLRPATVVVARTPPKS